MNDVILGRNGQRMHNRTEPMICIIEINHVLPLSLISKNSMRLCQLDTHKVRQANEIQHDLSEMACFLHALRASTVITYYKSRASTMYRFAEQTYGI